MHRNNKEADLKGHPTGDLMWKNLFLGGWGENSVNQKKVNWLINKHIRKKELIVSDNHQSNQAFNQVKNQVGIYRINR